MTQRGITFRFLSEEDVIGAGVLDMGACVETIEEVFALVARGDYLMGGPNQNDHGLMMWFPDDPVHPGMPAAGPDRRFMAMIAYLGGTFQIAGEKWYGSNTANREKGLPRSIHTITLNDVETGAPLSLMSGNLISAMRTGAVAGVASRHLAPPGSDTIAIIGAGVISKACARAIAYAMPGAACIKIFDLDKKRAQDFGTDLKAEFSATVQIAESLEAAVRDADVVSVATSGASAPAILEQWLKPGALLALTGHTRLADTLYENSRVVVDNWAMHTALYRDAAEHPSGLKSLESWAMSADLLRLWHEEKIQTCDIEEIGAYVIKGQNHAENRATIFISGGMPVEDIAWASRVHENAKKRELGQILQLWDAPHWA